MSTNRFDDETLMAYADGELDAETSAEVAAAIGGDPMLAARISAFTRSRILAKRAFEEAVPPVPDALRAAIEARIAAMAAPVPEPVPDLVTAPEPPAEARGGTGVGAPGVVSLEAARQRRRGLSAFAPIAMAASIAAVVAGGLGWYAGGSGGIGATAPGADMIALGAGPAITEVLGAAASGADTALPGGGRVRVVATFEDAEQRLCREFEYGRGDTGVIAVACRQQAAWQVVFAAAGPTTEGDFVPASGMEALDAYLSGIGAGTPLEPGAEKAALSR
ncbi:anti-sigma factor family protein [Methylobrevis pamukkalensis]|uniref:Anti-sigma factor n=1 Tax=Methylobrevis pamukkalensis TaxID=1439726 RepID=A0A1E3H1U0_9HYPH|nr:hypothetical protein [Methylobrevis pamukkalensis]ODN70280.1 hypothetical protein A6302_02372 [Methylobrevis pamukkalensis]